MQTPTHPSVEVIVVGAGLAGTAVAAVLGRQGRRVILVDPRPSYPPVFKAEMIDQEQVYLLRKLGLLVVVASGSSPRLEAQLRLRRSMIQRNQSFVFGFTIAPLESQAFDFDSVTSYSLEPSARIDYLTLFKIRQSMRANLFVFRPATDPWVREFILEPEQMLRRYLPKLGRVTGDFRIVSKIESGGADLYRMDGNPPPGMVMIGDAFQSVCPSTGMGLDKILTDVDVLSERVPDWLSTPGMGCGKLADFYNHPSKLATDSRALHRKRRINSLWSASLGGFLSLRDIRFESGYVRSGRKGISGGMGRNPSAFTEALATTRLFYHTLPKLRDWRQHRGLWAGIKASLYNQVFDPALVRHLLTLLSDPDSVRRSRNPAA
jgi:hypothetical protein